MELNQSISDLVEQSFPDKQLTTEEVSTSANQEEKIEAKLQIPSPAELFPPPKIKLPKLALPKFHPKHLKDAKYEDIFHWDLALCINFLLLCEPSQKILASQKTPCAVKLDVCSRLKFLLGMDSPAVGFFNSNIPHQQSHDEVPRGKENIPQNDEGNDPQRKSIIHNRTDLNPNQNGQNSAMTIVEEQKTKALILFHTIETLKIQLRLLSTFDLPIQMSPHFSSHETFLSQHPPGGLLLLREQILQQYAPTIRDQLHQHSKSKVT
jgi:hypothetical protein